MKARTIGLAVAVGLAVSAFAAGGASAESGIRLVASNVQQTDGDVSFDVNSTAWQTSFNGSNTYCDGTVWYADGQNSPITAAAASDPHDFTTSYAAWPTYNPDGSTTYPSVSKIDFTCDWTRTVGWYSWVTHRDEKSVEAASAYRGKVGPGHVYSYLSGDKTIDNRGSSRSTTAIFKIRHKGRGTSCGYYWSLAYTEPGPHPGLSCKNVGRVMTIKLVVRPRTMFTFTSVYAGYRWSAENHYTRDVDMSGAGSWTP